MQINLINFLIPILWLLVGHLSFKAMKKADQVLPGDLGWIKGQQVSQRFLWIVATIGGGISGIYGFLAMRDYYKHHQKT